MRKGRHTHHTVGKNRRLTFVECNNDMNSMLDVGKIADLVGCALPRTLPDLGTCYRVKPLPHCRLPRGLLVCSRPHLTMAIQVLLLVDGSFGFEMETFEFLNILQVLHTVQQRSWLPQCPCACRVGLASESISFTST